MHLHTVRHTQTHPSQINGSQWSILTLIMSNIVIRCLNALRIFASGNIVNFKAQQGPALPQGLAVLFQLNRKSTD